MDLNKVTLIGTVVHDPAPRPPKEGVVWSIKVHELVIYVVASGTLGAIVQQYVRAGSHVYVEGRLQVERAVLATSIVMLGQRGRREVPLEPKESA